MHFAICDFLLDLTQNSIEAGARLITIGVEEDRGWIEARVEDNGKGMGEEQLKRAKDPFYSDGTKHARRKVGLGIPFLLQSLELAGGSYELSSREGTGTSFSFRFPADGLDTPPMGDLPGLFLCAMCFDGDYEIVATHRAPSRGVEYEVRRSELLDAVGDLSDAGALVLARDFLVSQETS